jgi:hypothetical protein
MALLSGLVLHQPVRHKELIHSKRYGNPPHIFVHQRLLDYRHLLAGLLDI